MLEFIKVHKKHKDVLTVQQIAFARRNACLTGSENH